MRATIAAIAVCAATATPAMADLTMVSLTYRTGPYAAGGIPFSDGYADYFTMLNERDGGIGGVPIELLECEFGYATDRGVACYEETVTQGALVYQPLSTGVTVELIRRVQEDEVVLHTMGYGLTAASDGATYPYVFNFPAHYWDGAVAQIAYLKELYGGSLEGKRIMHMHHNSGYGREPIPTLEALAEIEGFELIMMPVDHPGEDQSAIWPVVAEESPDHILLWGWGVMNRVALEGAVEVGYPVDQMMGIWWSAAESDLKPLGDAVEGYRSVTFHAVGDNFAIFNDLNNLVYQRDLARGRMNNIGEALYNRGVAAAIYAAEAIRIAQEIHGVGDVTPPMVRDGYEQLTLDDAAFEALGMEGFTPPMQITCEDHGGGGMVAVAEWNSQQRRWVQITDYYPPDDALIEPQIREASAAFALANEITATGCPSN
ncbi:branched-chain amino acid transport system substrate-binding protein [Monaibacterium marinum]|uniref:Branched-chain amino acid transport system substrate-binding protein n=1 Tax=Pontivivens marinum TaxID=1690039 RepID=A0A2C9CV30_9RHOB|nr:ABC transporter substrate-binding protein [Monaibacterium marinum]SOH95216.1 branched-chain amino acid transport system substrate-binding protein [Monaibacterium marinum]